MSLLVSSTVNAEVKTYEGTDEHIMIRATVKANVDTDDVNKYLNKSAQEKSAIIMQKIRQRLKAIFKNFKLSTAGVKFICAKKIQKR